MLTSIDSLAGATEESVIQKGIVRHQASLSHLSKVIFSPLLHLHVLTQQYYLSTIPDSEHHLFTSSSALGLHSSSPNAQEPQVSHDLALENNFQEIVRMHSLPQRQRPNAELREHLQTAVTQKQELLKSPWLGIISKLAGHSVNSDLHLITPVC